MHKNSHKEKICHVYLIFLICKSWLCLKNVQYTAMGDKKFATIYTILCNIVANSPPFSHTNSMWFHNRQEVFEPERTLNLRA